MVLEVNFDPGVEMNSKVGLPMLHEMAIPGYKVDFSSTNCASYSSVQVVPTGGIPLSNFMPCPAILPKMF